MEKTIRQQVKENFQTMEFTKAMKVNNELKAEYIRVCGQRSWTSLVNAYYRKSMQPAKEIEEQPVTEETTVIEEPVIERPEVEESETQEQPEVEEQPTEGVENEAPANMDEVRFSPNEILDYQFIKQLVTTNAPILNQFCVIQEFFKRESDTETIRLTSMFVKSDGTGWKLYDEGSAAGKEAGLKSYRKLGYFDLSNDGFPVGEEYCQITVMRIKKALEKFVLNRTGVTQVTRVNVF